MRQQNPQQADGVGQPRKQQARRTPNVKEDRPVPVQVESWKILIEIELQARTKNSRRQESEGEQEQMKRETPERGRGYWLLQC
jgi:hypothetical protein